MSYGSLLRTWAAPDSLLSMYAHGSRAAAVCGFAQALSWALSLDRRRQLQAAPPSIGAVPHISAAVRVLASGYMHASPWSATAPTQSSSAWRACQELEGEACAGASPGDVLAKAKRMAELVGKAQQRSANRRAILEQSRLRKHRK